MIGDITQQRRVVESAPVIDRETALKAVNWALLERHCKKQKSIATAKVVPLPGASGKAFTTGNIKAGGKIVFRAVPAHFAVLQALESPLLKMMENAMTKSEVKLDFKPSEQWEVCYVFTEDAEKVYDLLESEGVKAIKKVARKEVGMKWDAASVNLVMLAILEQIKRHVETTVKFAADMQEAAEVTFFQELTEKSP